MGRRRHGGARFAVLAALVGLSLAFGSGRIGAGDGAAGEPAVFARWRLFGVENGLPDASIRSIRVVGDEVWVGTDGGLARLRDDGWSVWTAADGLPGEPISAIATDAGTGDVWLGTLGGGLVRFTAGRFDRFTQFDSGLAGDQVFDVAAAEGRIWVATNGGISSLEPATRSWDLYVEPTADRPEIAVTSFDRGPGGLSAGTWCGPLLRFDARAGEWVPDTPTGSGPGLRPDTGVAVASSGRSLWWVTRGGLFRLAREASSEVFPLPGLASTRAFVNGLAARNDDEVWLGTDAGLLVLGDRASRSWVAYTSADGAAGGSVTWVRAGEIVGSRPLESAIPGSRIRCVAFQNDAIWIGTPSGLGRGSDPVAWSDLRASERRRERIAPSTSMPGATPPEAGSRRVSIGVLHPLARPISRPGDDSTHRAGAVDRRSVGRAVDRATARRRSLGQPEFALAESLYSFARYRWGTPQDTFSILRDLHDVRGFVGHLEPDARIDTAVALRTELPLVNVAPTDPTADETFNPWVFRCGSNDPRRHRRLLDHVVDGMGRHRLAIVATPDPGARVHLDRWAAHARARGHEPVIEAEVDPAVDDLSSLLEDLRRSRAEVVFTWADAAATAGLLRAMRSAALDALLVGSDRIVGPDFIDLVGPDPGEVVAFARCPHFEVTADTASRAAADRRDVPGLPRVEASPQAERSFDAAVHLLAAIEIAGPEPDAIRGALREMSRVELAILEDGAWRIAPLDVR